MSQENKVFVDPLNISAEDLPLIVLSDNLRKFIPWAIKSHTSGNYNHVMVMIHPGEVVSQDLTFKVKPITKYMTPAYRLKFWQFKDMTAEEKVAFEKAVQADLDLPLYKRLYDPLGILGKLIRVPWINIPWLDYCSEKVIQFARKFLPSLGDHPSPSEINCECKNNPRMQVFGWWFFD